MPHSIEQWCWFVFFAIGAGGGWLALAMAFGAVMIRVRRGR